MCLDVNLQEIVLQFLVYLHSELHEMNTSRGGVCWLLMTLVECYHGLGLQPAGLLYRVLAAWVLLPGLIL